MVYRLKSEEIESPLSLDSFEVEVNILRLKYTPFRYKYGSFQGSGEFHIVAGPGIINQGLEGFFRQLDDFFAEFLAVLIQVMFDEARYFSSTAP